MERILLSTSHCRSLPWRLPACAVYHHPNILPGPASRKSGKVVVQFTHNSLNNFLSPLNSPKGHYIQ